MVILTAIILASVIIAIISAISDHINNYSPSPDPNTTLYHPSELSIIPAGAFSYAVISPTGAQLHTGTQASCNAFISSHTIKE